VKRLLVVASADNEIVMRESFNLRRSLWAAGKSTYRRRQHIPARKAIGRDYPSSVFVEWKVAFDQRDARKFIQNHSI
jgi:hypothetical protein